MKILLAKIEADRSVMSREFLMILPENGQQIKACFEYSAYL
jgi:hypothetical protein